MAKIWRQGKSRQLIRGKETQTMMNSNKNVNHSAVWQFSVAKAVAYFIYYLADRHGNERAMLANDIDN